VYVAQCTRGATTNALNSPRHLLFASDKLLKQSKKRQSATCAEQAPTVASGTVDFWSLDDIARFTAILGRCPLSSYNGRTERFAAVSKEMGGGRFGKRACYAQFKLLKSSGVLEKQSAAPPKPAVRRGWSSFGVNDDEPKAPMAAAPKPAAARPSASSSSSGISNAAGGWLSSVPASSSASTEPRAGASSAARADACRPAPSSGGWSGGGGGGWSSFGSAAGEAPRASAAAAPRVSASAPSRPRDGPLRIEEQRALWWRTGGSSSNRSSARTPPRISRAEATELRRATIGARRPWAESWSQQGFFFSAEEGLRYGLVQRTGGPCGVLAALQAHIIKWLAAAYSSADGADGADTLPAWFNPSTEAQRAALIDALADLLWRCAESGESGTCCVALRGDRGRPRATGGDGSGGATGVPRGGVDALTEQLTVHRGLASRRAVRTLLDDDGVLGHFADPTGGGVILLAYSCVLSHGVRAVEAEAATKLGEEGGASGGDALIGGHDYAGQELVNLLLSGAAVPQVFNGRKEIDGCELRGVDARTEVGFLSLYEALNPGFVEVGSHLKTPTRPIWIVCSEDHYTVLFALQGPGGVRATGLELDAGQQRGEPFDIYYYDELASQDEVIRLGVTPRPEIPLSAAEKGEDATELISPIDHCIRTRWVGARIDWGDVEPLL
jgi:hypothetical protein